MKNSLYIEQTSSTNNILWDLSRQQDLPEGFVVYTDFQTAGKGQAGNSWESEKGENLLFSLLLKPAQVEITEHFLLSQIISIGIKRVLDNYADHIAIKWPNDIYWQDEKIAGILVENSIKNNHIKNSVVGIGLNVNQIDFKSAPNAVSLKKITREQHDGLILLETIRDSILEIYRNWNEEEIRNAYMNGLYRKTGFYSFKAGDEIFDAEIADIYPDGKMDLKAKKGKIRSFYFKEVQFVL